MIKGYDRWKTMTPEEDYGKDVYCPKCGDELNDFEECDRCLKEGLCVQCEDNEIDVEDLCNDCIKENEG